MNPQTGLNKENTSPYQPLMSEWLSLPKPPRSANVKNPSKEEKAIMRNSSKIVAQKLREFEYEIESSCYKQNNVIPRRISTPSHTREKLSAAMYRNQLPSFLTQQLMLAARQYDDLDPLMRIPKDTMKNDTVADLAKAYGPIGLSVRKSSQFRSQNYAYRSPAAVPLSPARYLMFRQPSQTGSVTSRLKTVRSGSKSRTATGHQKKKSKTAIENTSPIPVSATSSKILNVKKYEEDATTNKAPPNHTKSVYNNLNGKPNKAVKSRVSTVSKSSLVNPQSNKKPRSRSAEIDPRPSVASIPNANLDSLPSTTEMEALELQEQTQNVNNNNSIASDPNPDNASTNGKKAGKAASTKVAKSLKSMSSKAKQTTEAKSDLCSELGPISTENAQPNKTNKENTSVKTRNNDDSKSIAPSGISESAPLKGILKSTKSHLESTTSTPWSNVGLCTAQPGTPEWMSYWEKYDKALANYKLSEATFLQENQSYRQDIEKYSKEAARITLEDAIFRQSIGLEPKKVHEVIGHQITELTTLNGFVFDRNCGSEGLLAYLSSCGSKGFRLEIDVRGQDPDKVKVEADFNLVKVLVPSGNGNVHRSVVIGLPHEYDMKDLEVFPVRNGWLLIESKERKQIGDVI